jgi:hypothetical protein
VCRVPSRLRVRVGRVVHVLDDYFSLLSVAELSRFDDPLRVVRVDPFVRELYELIPLYENCQRGLNRAGST